MDPATNRYRKAMIAPRTGGKCRYCHHHVDDRHVGDWCKDCELLGQSCGAALRLATRAEERAISRAVR